ncbi:hypothetical protein ABZ608_13000 [Streptomyces sp. NPDC013172]|uniref:hypothetical protein n=1 Tax=Streptomyces sp. NPDC013172 TaxID=3155009 RepID=UPI0033F3BA4C
MLRKLNVEFRGNGLPDELYSKLIRNGAVMHMKNTCSPAAGDVKIRTPGWAVEAAARIGAEMTARIDALGVRVVGDRIAPGVAARALYGALAAAAVALVRHAADAQTRTVDQTSSRELVRVLGH